MAAGHLHVCSREGGSVSRGHGPGGGDSHGSLVVVYLCHTHGMCVCGGGGGNM